MSQIIQRQESLVLYNHSIFSGVSLTPCSEQHELKVGNAHAGNGKKDPVDRVRGNNVYSCKKTFNTLWVTPIISERPVATSHAHI
jgi:hypothetical protein